MPARPIQAKQIEQPALVRVVGSSGTSSAPAAYTTVPDMSVSFTPKVSLASVFFEATVILAPSGPGDEVRANFRPTVGGTPVAGAMRSIGLEADFILSLVAGRDISRMVLGPVPLTGLTPGTPVTVAVQWRLDPSFSAGSVSLVSNQRSIMVRDRWP